MASLVVLLIASRFALSLSKDADTLVFAVLGDWGWSASGNHTLLTAPLSATCRAFNLSTTGMLGKCLDGDKVSQGMLVESGLSQVPQIATAMAMASKCTAAGGCDFITTLGDNFYDLGIFGGTSDPQWEESFQKVYTKKLFGDTPFLITLGNHDYTILADGSPGNEATSGIQAQLDYTKIDSRWVLPARNYDRTFQSESGNVGIQMVSLDSTPLTDRYIVSGASGGGFASDRRGMNAIPNANDVNAILSPGVTVANGWPAGGNLYNATNFQCRFDWSTGALLPGCNATNTTTKTCVNHKASCKYAPYELGKYAAPPQRAAAYNETRSRFMAGSGKVQYQVLFTHFPVLSTEQRIDPFHDEALKMFSSLGKDAPQVVFTGHDHLAAFLKLPDLDIGFIQAGHGGLSNGALSATPVVPAQGYISEDDSKSLLDNFIAAAYTPKPAPGVVASPKYNPDVNYTKFYSDLNGFVLVTVNKTWMRVDYYFVNCSGLYTTGACSSDVMGPVYSKYFPAKTVANGSTTTTATTTTATKTTTTTKTNAKTITNTATSRRLGLGAVVLGMLTLAQGQFF